MSTITFLSYLIPLSLFLGVVATAYVVWSLKNQPLSPLDDAVHDPARSFWIDNDHSNDAL